MNAGILVGLANPAFMAGSIAYIEIRGSEPKNVIVPLEAYNALRKQLIMRSGNN